MKRGLVALILFCICVVFSVFCAEKSKTVLNNANENINEIRLLCEKNENEKALKKAKDFKKEWEDLRFILRISFDRSAVKEIEATVIALPELLEMGKTDEVLTQCETALFEIEYLLDGEKLRLENIF